MKAKYKSKINKLKNYREILLLCKTLQVINKIDMKIENRIPTYGSDKLNKSKKKILMLY